MAVRAVLFDFGETLVRDSRPAEETVPRAVAASYEALKRNGLTLEYGRYRDISGAVFKKHWGLQLEGGRPVSDLSVYREVVGSLFQSNREPWRERVAGEANDAFWRVITDNYVANLHARDALAELAAMKLRMAVVSNLSSPEAVPATLKRLRISGYFAGTFVSSGVGVAKPDPRIFEICLSSIQATADQAVFVGDSPSLDVAGAKRAGMRAVLLAGDVSISQPSRKDEEPDFIVHDLLEVPRIVSSLT